MTFIPNSEIEDEETLYRAIHPSFWKEEEGRPTSALFKDSKGVSVDRDGEREEKEIASSILSTRDEFGLAKLNAGEARNLGTYLKPDSQPDNKYHALILSSETKAKLSNSVARKLSTLVKIIIVPSND